MPAWVIPLLSVCVSVGSLCVAWQTSRSSAKRDEVDALRGIIAELRIQVDELEVEVNAWKRRFIRVCRRAGLEPDEQITGPLSDFTGPTGVKGGG